MAEPEGGSLRLFHALYDALDTLEADKVERLMQQIDGLRYGGRSLDELLPGAREAVARFDFTPVQEQIGLLLRQLEAAGAAAGEGGEGGKDGR